MAQYCIDHKKKNQKTLTHFNIESKVEHKKLEKTPRVIVKESVDYSVCSLEDLEKAYLTASYVQRQSILFHLKQRGIDIRSFQSKHEDKPKLNK